MAVEIDFDDMGWTAIHHCVAAETELLMSIEKFISSNDEYLEVETQDDDQLTPLLLAVERNKARSVKMLLDFGIRIKINVLNLDYFFVQNYAK